MIFSPVANLMHHSLVQKTSFKMINIFWMVFEKIGNSVVLYLDNLYVQLLSLLQFSVSVVSQFVRDMKRSDHVSLCTTTPSSITSSNNSSNNGGKKLRKRRELNAMAAPHVIVRSSQGQQSNNSSNRSGNKKSDYKSIYFSNSSSNNNEDDGWCFFLHLFP